MKRFNDWLGLKITNGVSTMWCAYWFAIIALVGYPYGSTDPRVIVQWFAQEFLQLVLLSIILVGQKLATKKMSEIHAKHKDTHELVSKSHDKIDAIYKHLGIKE